MERMRRLQAGVGLVELMVTMLLSALVVAGVISLFNANRQSFRLQDSLALAQESGGFALEFITTDLNRAGYTESGTGPAAIDVDDFSANDVETTVKVKIGADEPDVTFEHDELSLVYQVSADTLETTCTGAAVPPGTEFLSNRYWVEVDGTGNGTLMCQGFALTLDDDVITNRVAIGNAEAMVSGVDSFQVMYGVDTTWDLDPMGTAGGCVDSPAAPNMYVNGDLLDDALLHGRNVAVPGCQRELTPRDVIRAIRIGMLVRTEANLNIDAPDDITYTVLDKTLDTATFPVLDDGRLRRLFTTTVQLRNVNRTFNPDGSIE